MKDKEKAVEIANKQKKYYGNPQYEMSKENFSASECFKSAMEMAQWKEKQMIEKACDYLYNNIDKDLVIYYDNTWLKRDEFVKRFKKAMEK